MPNNVSIGLIGDYNSAVPAHQAIPLALRMAAQELNVDVAYEWIATEQAASVARISRFNGLWCVPASPYRNMEGALFAIRHAREHSIPFLGTCGGFQHAVIEYARNALGWTTATHAESAPDSECAVISALTCGLLDTATTIRLIPGTHIASAYGAI